MNEITRRFRLGGTRSPNAEKRPEENKLILAQLCYLRNPPDFRGLCKNTRSGRAKTLSILQPLFILQFEICNYQFEISNP
jgi:hypothetical protein